MKKFQTEVQLSREMGLMDATMIGVGAMIGAGIFVLTGIAAGVAGPALIIAFILNGGVALLTAMSYAELGSCYHDAGGGYLWVKEGLPKWNGFISGWMSWFAHAVACSLYALGFGAYFEHVLRELGVAIPDWGFLSPQKILAVAVAILFAYINFRGASETGKVGNIVTMTKIVILGIFIAFGLELILRKGDLQQALTPFMPYGWAGIIKAMGLTFIAFQGFEVISQASEELRNPKKNIPRAVFLSLAIVVPIYVLIAVTAIGAVHPENGTPWAYLAFYKEIALVEVAKQFFVGGGIMLLVGGLISTMSALNATVYSSSRVAFAMGRDRNFPTFFGRVHPKNFTPHRAIFFSFLIVVLMAVSLPIEDVASAADVMFLLLFLQVNITLIRLRKKRPDLDRGFFVPLFPWLTIIGIVMLLFLAVYLFNYSPTAWIVTLGWIGVGLVIYRFYASKREIEHVKRVSALEQLERKEYRILVAVSSLKSAENLSRVAISIAEKTKAQMIFLHVIEVGEGQPLRAGLKEEAEGAALLEKATASASKSGMIVRPILRVSHRLSQGIIETAEEENCNFVILGREKLPTFFEKFFSSSIDSVIQEAPCEVAVLHGEIPSRGIRGLLIPFGHNIHTRLAVEIAPAFVDHFRCEARIAVVFEPDVPYSSRNQRMEEIRELVKANGLAARIDVVHDKDVLQGVLQQSKGTDLLLMGGRTGDFLGLLLGQSLTQEITERVACPVLWVKEYEERASFWSTLFKPFPKEVEERHGQFRTEPVLQRMGENH
jgi:amino acid transporter/nucleotide-binding universal stress UspA family protein